MKFLHNGCKIETFGGVSHSKTARFVGRSGARLIVRNIRTLTQLVTLSCFRIAKKNRRVKCIFTRYTMNNETRLHFHYGPVIRPLGFLSHRSLWEFWHVLSCLWSPIAFIAMCRCLLERGAV